MERRIKAALMRSLEVSLPLQGRPAGGLAAALGRQLLIAATPLLASLSRYRGQPILKSSLSLSQRVHELLTLRSPGHANSPLADGPLTVLQIEATDAASPL